MILIELYGPALLSIVLIIISVKIKIEDRVLFTIKPPFLELSIPIKSVILCRAILVCLSLVCVYRYFIMDFSRFFPKEYIIEVFYDEDGLRESLSKFSSKELNQIGVIDNNRESAKIYYEDLDKTLKDMLGYEEFFTAKNGTVYSHGESNFKAEKISGFHKYYIVQADGEITNTLDRQREPSISCKSIFKKTPSSHDYLRLSFSDIFVKRSIIVQPRFKQILKENDRSNEVVFDHILIGVTIVNFFPVPSFENCIYFFELPNGKFVPIAYADFKY